MLIYNVLHENPDSTNLNSFSSLEKAYNFLLEISKHDQDIKLFNAPKIEEVKDHFNCGYKFHQGYYCFSKMKEYGTWYHLFEVQLDEDRNQPGFSMFEKFHPKELQQDQIDNRVYDIKEILYSENGVKVPKIEIEFEENFEKEPIFSSENYQEEIEKKYESLRSKVPDLSGLCDDAESEVFAAIEKMKPPIYTFFKNVSEKNV